MRGDIYEPGGQCVNWYNFSEEKRDNIYPDKRHTDSLTQLSHLEEFILKLYLHVDEIPAFRCIHGSMIVNVKDRKQIQCPTTGTTKINDGPPLRCKTLQEGGTKPTMNSFLGNIVK